jgi:hypothetical protein
MVLPVPATGSISKVVFRTYTVTSSQSVKVSLQGLDANGDPSGTILGATNNGYGTVATLATSTTYTVTLGENVSVTKNQMVAIVFEWTATQGQIIFATTESANENMNTAATNCYDDYYAAAAWTKTGKVSVIVNLIYNVSGSDTHYYNPHAIIPHAAGSRVNLTTASSPCEMGNRIVMPFAAEVGGLFARLGAALTGATSLVLYDANRNVLGSQASYVSTSTWLMAKFAPVYLTKGQVIYCTIRPDTATSWANGSVNITYAAAEMATVLLGSNLSYVQRNPGNGAFTETTSKFTTMGLLLSGIEGGTYNPFEGGLIL